MYSVRIDRDQSRLQQLELLFNMYTDMYSVYIYIYIYSDPVE